MKRKIVIIGIGTAGLRFAEILHRKHIAVGVYMHRKTVHIPNYCKSLFSLEACCEYGAVIVASPPATHLQYVSYFVAKQIPVLVEKPFADSLIGLRSVIKKALQTKTILRCGYNLRYLPVIQTIQKWITENRLGVIVAAEFSVGQYLPFWRPGRDYGKAYSAQYELGGGVALDLIHELDMALWLFPQTRLQPIIASKLSNLNISVEDFVVYASKHKPFIMVAMNYLSHIYTRRYKIIGSDGSLECDIANKRLLFMSSDGKKEEITDASQFDISKTYEVELDAFIADIERGSGVVNEHALGIDALKLALKGRRHVKV